MNLRVPKHNVLRRNHAAFGGPGYDPQAYGPVVVIQQAANCFHGSTINRLERTAWVGPCKEVSSEELDATLPVSGFAGFPLKLLPWHEEIGERQVGQEA
jgi:hypothetical protein